MIPLLALSTVVVAFFADLQKTTLPEVRATVDYAVIAIRKGRRKLALRSLHELQEHVRATVATIDKLELAWADLFDDHAKKLDAIVVWYDELPEFRPDREEEVIATLQLWKAKYSDSLERLKPFEVLTAIEEPRQSIVRSLAQTIWLLAWADGVEQYEEAMRNAGREVEDFIPSGSQIEKIAPPIPIRPLIAALEYVEKLEGENGGTKVEDLYATVADEGTPERFGHDLAMEASGHGVGVHDDFPTAKFEVPYDEYCGYYPWDALDDVGLVMPPEADGG